MSSPAWLLLAHQLPAQPSNARVKTWRRLQQLGAVPARNSVYVLPNTESCREDFEWLRGEIVSLGGEATVFTGDAVNREGGEDIMATFHKARQADYEGIAREARDITARTGAGNPAGGPDAEARRREARALREKFNAILQIDHFGAPGKTEAAAAVAALEGAAGRGKSGGRTRAAAAKLEPAAFRSRRWVTRPRPGVDRMASAWLIRRFVDSRARFSFAARPAASQVPFDMYTGEFSHKGELCTFEVLAQRFGLKNAAVQRIGQIVHDLDMKETRYAPPEAPAIGRMVEGLRSVHADDDAALLQSGIEMFEALAASFELAGPSGPRSPARGRGKGRTAS
ncbi:MAG: chromate resistance protein [Acidobacteria bacterium]|nr:chromate resistance protein [Acidobacteriota bacterium]MCA1612272.1 chromate resistance protein [Acidobacteriota bacterium]